MSQDPALAPAPKALLAVWKATLSPVFMAFGVRCRYHPSCSEYAALCVSRHGVWAGGWMALARLSRCRPGGSRGLDPPPGAPAPGARWFAPWRYGVWRPPSEAGASAPGDGPL